MSEASTRASSVEWDRWLTPGLTALAQVNGGTQMSWPERWEYDLRYARELSFGVDLGILLRTVTVVLLGEERFHNPPRDE